jgi:hypothetical protein
MDKTKTKAEPDIPATMIESGIADATEEFLNTICPLRTLCPFFTSRLRVYLRYLD